MTNPLADELAEDRHAQPCVLVIFGATGDLTHRKLVPALMGLAQDGLLPTNFAVVGFARRPKTDEEFHDDLLAGVREHARGEGEKTFESLKSGITYHRRPSKTRRATRDCARGSKRSITSAAHRAIASSTWQHRRARIQSSWSS